MAGTTVMKSASVLVATLVVVVVLLGSSASAATDPALTVQNDLTQTITVLYEWCPRCPPVGECLPCRTPTFKVASKKSGSVESELGYPLKYLKIQVGDVVYCLTQHELKPLTGHAVITVGPPRQPGIARCPNSELSVYIVDKSKGIRYHTWLKVCSSLKGELSITDVIENK